MGKTIRKLTPEECRFRGDDLVAFQLLADEQPKDGGTQVSKREWSMVANTGKAMARWWGNLVLDLDGAQYEQRVALLLDHATSERLGFSTKIEKTSRGLEAQGKLLQNELADQVMKESRQGFPWQASLMAVPMRIEEVEPNVQVTVNGQLMVGPLTIFRQWQLRELTLTVLGADSSTAAEAFAATGEETLNMTTKIEEPAQKLANGQAAPAPSPQPPAAVPSPNHEALAAEKAAQATDAERRRASEILRHCSPEQMELGQRLISDNVPLQEALSQIIRDTRERLAVPRNSNTEPQGLGNAAQLTVSAEARMAALPEDENKWRAQFAADHKLRTEFLGQEKAYLAFCKHQDRFRLSGSTRDGMLFSMPAERLSGGLVGLSPRNIVGTYFWALEESQAASWVGKIAQSIVSDQPYEILKWLDSVPAMQKWTGERRQKALRDFQLTVLNDKFESTVTFDIDDLRRDKTGQALVRIRELAGKAATLEQRLFTAALEANANGYDGAAFFADTHSHGGTVDNNLSYTCTAPDTPTSAEMVAAILASIQAQNGFTDSTGDPANEFAKSFLVMVPVKFQAAAEAALGNDFTSAGVSNTIKSMASKISIDLVVNPRLTGTAAAAGRRFYTFRTDAPVKPLVWCEEKLMDGLKMQGEDSADGFWKDRVAVGAKRIGTGACGRFELASRTTLA